MTLVIAQCDWCKHLVRDRAGPASCRAFDMIPIEILLGKFDHRKAYPGDRGVRYEAIDPDPTTKAEWREEDHPRARDGKFTDAGSAEAGPAPKDEPKDEKPKAPKAPRAPKAPNSTKTWGTFREYVGIHRRWLLDMKAKQAEYEKNGGTLGTRYDHDPKAKPPTSQGARSEIAMHGGAVGHYVLSEGKEFPVPKDPPPFPLGKPKNCFENAGRIVLDDDEYDYAEGYVVSEGKLMPVLHAWVVHRVTGEVRDPTLGWDPGNLYIGVRLPKLELVRHLARNHYWGILMAGDDMPSKLVEDWWEKNKGTVKEEDFDFRALRAVFDAIHGKKKVG